MKLDELRQDAKEGIDVEPKPQVYSAERPQTPEDGRCEHPGCRGEGLITTNMKGVWCREHMMEKLGVTSPAPPTTIQTMGLSEVGALKVGEIVIIRDTENSFELTSITGTDGTYAGNSVCVIGGDGLA